MEKKQNIFIVHSTLPQYGLGEAAKPSFGSDSE